MLCIHWNQRLLLCSQSCWLSEHSVPKFCFNIGLQLQTCWLYLGLASGILTPLQQICSPLFYLDFHNYFVKSFQNIWPTASLAQGECESFPFHSTLGAQQAGELLPIASFFHPSSSMFFCFFSCLCFEKQRFPEKPSSNWVVCVYWFFPLNLFLPFSLNVYLRK